MKRFLGMRVLPQPTPEERLAQRQLIGEHLARRADDPKISRRESNRLADAALHWLTTSPPKQADIFGLYENK